SVSCFRAGASGARINSAETERHASFPRSLRLLPACMDENQIDKRRRSLPPCIILDPRRMTTMPDADNVPIVLNTSTCEQTAVEFTAFEIGTPLLTNSGDFFHAKVLTGSIFTAR